MKNQKLIIVVAAIAVAVIVGVALVFSQGGFFQGKLGVINVNDLSKQTQNLSFCLKYPNGTSDVTGMVNNKPVTTKVPCKPIKVNPNALKVIGQ